MATETEVVGYIDLTPSFNYHRHVEIVKRFMEQLSKLSGDEHLGSEAIAYVRTNLPHVRDAMSHVLTDDIERQIQITRDFPLAKQLYLHDFVPEGQPGGWPIGKPDPHCVESDCYALPDTLIHTL